MLFNNDCFWKNKLGQNIDFGNPQTWPRYWLHSMHIYIYIYIYAVVLLSGPSLAFWGVIIWAKFAFYKTLFVKKHYKIGVSALLYWKKKCARKFEVLLSGPSWPFLSCSQLGPDNNTYLGQIITPQNGFFFKFLLLKMCRNTYFIVLFEHQPKLGKKRGKKNDNFSHFAKHRLLKKPFCCNTPFHQKIVFFKLFVLKPKTFMLNKNIT